MLVMESGSSIEVYGLGGRLVHQSHKVIQYSKTSPTSLVVITKDTVDFVKEVVIEGRKDILVVKDTQFELALTQGGFTFIQRKISVPILDIYDSELNNVVRLHKNLNGKWVYMLTVAGVPYKFLEPTHIKEFSSLYARKSGKQYRVDLATNKLYTGEFKGERGTAISNTLARFK